MRRWKHISSENTSKTNHLHYVSEVLSPFFLRYEPAQKIIPKQHCIVCVLVFHKNGIYSFRHGNMYLVYGIPGVPLVRAKSQLYTAYQVPGTVIRATKVNSTKYC